MIQIQSTKITAHISVEYTLAQHSNISCSKTKPREALQ